MKPYRPARIRSKIRNAHAGPARTRPLFTASLSRSATIIRSLCSRPAMATFKARPSIELPHQPKEAKGRSIIPKRNMTG